MLLKLVRFLVPAPARRAAGEAVRAAVLRVAMRRFVRDPDAGIDDPKLLSRLIFGWGNTGWSASHEYLRACLEHARAADRPILECGSGLSTLLLGAVAQRHGNRVWSLEHHPEWGRRVEKALASFGIDVVRVCVAPLRSYGEYSWYAPSLATMPESFSTVVCDGPPGRTPGGRYGLSPVMGPRLAKGCVILLDDARRAHERETAERWAAELGATCEIVGSDRPFARLVVGEAAAAMVD